jgi:3,4-dihydroxy 2-butanone 4-phosphate synthase/GTP cyclohydrolase II
LLTNNPKKVVGLEAYGLEIVERIPIQVASTSENADYLETKRVKLGHLIEPAPRKRPAKK